MGDYDDKLRKLLEEDDLIEAKGQPKRIAADVDETIRQQFLDIVSFVEANGRAPRERDPDSGKPSPISERFLATRLAAWARQPVLIEKLKDIDIHGLFETSRGKEAITIPDGLVDEDPDAALAMLLDQVEFPDAPDTDIFTLRHVGPNARSVTDYIAERRPCDDFERFKPLFDACAQDLAAGRRKTVPFTLSSDIKEGAFYILNGIILYVARIDDFTFRTKGRNRDARMRVILDNGTEYDPLFRSLGRALQGDDNGRRITEIGEGALFDGGQDKPEAILSGYVYVARTLSTQKDVRKLRDFYKIGTTANNPRTRIANARNDATFLLSDAHLVKHYAIYDTPHRAVERKLHSFFSSACLEIEITDRFGKAVKANEWFTVPLSIVDEAINLVMRGKIGSYEYDMINQMIIPAETR